MKINYLLRASLLVCALLSACRQADNPAPAQSAEQLLTNKWWCPAGQFGQQYFGADGTWKQRLTTTDQPDTGTWRFSADKKTIQIRDVKSDSQLLKEWDYSVDKLEAGALRLNFLGIAIQHTPCP